VGFPSSSLVMLVVEQQTWSWWLASYYVSGHNSSFYGLSMLLIIELNISREISANLSLN
jgi:hypothetical protein